MASTEVTSLQRSGNNLFLYYGASDRVMISNYFSSNAYEVERFVFSDGVTWTETDIRALVQTLGTTASDSITGYNDGENRIFGLDGNDTLTGGALNDQIDGGNGADTLNGDDGNDLLIGGAGDDTLKGGKGNDTYLFVKGAGIDTISENDSTTGNKDLLSFTGDIAPEQLWFRQTGSNLEVSIIGTSDKVTINNWYSSGAYRVEQFETANGQSLVDSQVQNLVNAMAAFGVPAGSEGNLTTEQRQQLDVVLAANWQ